MSIYTHNYEFNAGTEGNIFIKGECEFNTDGLMSYKITQSSDPLSPDTLKHFMEFMDLLHKVYEKTGNIKLIKVKLKD
jgi:hypothetical protein